MTEKKKDLQQERLLKELYSPFSNSNEERYLSEIGGFLEHALRISNSKDAVLKETGRLIHQIFEFKEIAFGVRDSDGMYRYHEMIGFRNEAENARKQIVYNNKDMTDGASFKSIRIGKYSQIHLSEYEPFKSGEEATFNHPELLGKPRTNADDMIEGDYLDTFLIGRQKEILGWIELSGTRNGKLPSREVLLFLEFIASCLPLFLVHTRKN